MRTTPRGPAPRHRRAADLEPGLVRRVAGTGATKVVAVEPFVAYEFVDDRHAFPRAVPVAAAERTDAPPEPAKG